MLSPVILTKYVVRQMMADGAGRIINMSSIIASAGYNGLSVYRATKAAATGFTRSLAREVGKLGITINVVAPSFINTELTQTLSDDQRKRIASRDSLPTRVMSGGFDTAMGASGERRAGSQSRLDQVINMATRW